MEDSNQNLELELELELEVCTHHHVEEAVIGTAAHCGQHRHEVSVYIAAHLLIPVGMRHTITVRVDNQPKAAYQHKHIRLVARRYELLPVHQLGHGKGGLNLYERRVMIITRGRRRISGRKEVEQRRRTSLTISVSP